jgi:hypothetical protein
MGRFGWRKAQFSQENQGVQGEFVSQVQGQGIVDFFIYDGERPTLSDYNAVVTEFPRPLANTLEELMPPTYAREKAVIERGILNQVDGELSLRLSTDEKGKASPSGHTLTPSA